MAKDSTAKAVADPIGRRCRMVGVGLGISYVLMPTMVINLRLLSDSLHDTLWAPLMTSFFPVGVPTLGVLTLGFLGASLWQPAGRDWPALDRAFGIFLLVAAAMMAFNLFLFYNWPPSRPFYAETTLRLLLVIALLRFLLVLSSAGLFFTRYSWASAPLGLLVLLGLVLRFAPVKPDHPDFLKEREQSARIAPFYQAVDNVFWEKYWTTRDPEAVAALFIDLPPEARSSLSGFMGEDAVRALLERGDDSAFLQALPHGTRRDEDGSFVPQIPQMDARITVITTPYLFIVALAYALTRSLMAVRSLTAAPTLREQPPHDQQLQG